jgi:uncharacterized GH25 family protein
MRLLLCSSFVLATLGLGSAADAHDTWLRPLTAESPAGGTLRAHLTSGMQFPVLESAIAPARIARADLRLAGAITKVTSFKSAKRSLTLGAPLPKAGIATLVIALAPKRLSLDEAHVAEYLGEIGMTESILPLWRSLPATRRWLETYRKLAKSFVRVGEPGAMDASGQEPAGLPLEIVPESDPTTLQAGDLLAVRLLKDGAGLPRLAIAAVHDGQRSLVTTDAEGRARFTLAAAGPWMFAATELRRRPDGEWESDFTTMVVEVKAAR